VGVSPTAAKLDRICGFFWSKIVNETPLVDDNTQEQRDKLPYVAPHLIELDPKEAQGGGLSISETDGSGFAS
jgi:hypothetical protein